MNTNSVPLKLDLLAEQPCLTITREGSSIIYSGPAILNGNIYQIKVKEYTEDGLRKFMFINADNIEKKCPGIVDKLNKIQTDTINSYLKLLQKLIESYKPPLRNLTSIYRKVCLEMQEFSEFYIDLRKLELSPDFSAIKVSCVDQSNREHNLEFGVDFLDVSNIFFFKELNVPVKDNSLAKKKLSNLKELYNLFLSYIEQLELFFQFMDLIDTNSTVLDPTDNRMKYCYRRILLEKNFSVIITVDPCNINCCPNFAFVGSDKLIDKYQCRLREYLDKWNEEDYLYDQLLSVFGLEEFPKDLNVMNHSNVCDEISVSNDCYICFSSELEGSLPDVICDNESCSGIYHRNCLFEWLSSIESRKYFCYIQGPCPNCENNISCPTST